MKRSTGNPLPYRLFAILLLLDVLVLLVEKAAAFYAVGAPTFALGLAGRPWLWLSLAIGPVQLLVWRRILARAALSVAYPVSSLSYPLTMLASRFVFGEQISLSAWVGGLLVTVGVALVSSQAGGRLRTTPSLSL